MKPEIEYLGIVVVSYIDDLIDNIERDMERTSLQDPYFKQLSVEKFALETLFKEIAGQDAVTTTEILQRFIQKMDNCANKNSDPDHNYTFEVSRDAAMSILDGLYFGYLEGGRMKSETKEWPDKTGRT